MYRPLINHRRACAARVTLVVLCLSVCLLSHISPTERIFVLKMLSRTQRAKKVKQFVGICLKRLRSRVIPRNTSEKANSYANSDSPAVSFLRLTQGKVPEGAHSLAQNDAY